MTVEAAGEFQHMDLQTQVQSVTKRRVTPHRYSRSVPLPVNPSGTSVDALSGDQLVLTRIKIGRRKAERSPALLTVDNPRTDKKRIAKQARSLFEISFFDARPHACAADRSSAFFKLRDELDFQPKLRAVSAKEVPVPRPATAKTKIAADDDPIKRNALPQFVEKNLRLGVREYARKRDLDRLGHPETAAQKTFFLLRKEPRFQSAEDKARMGLERDQSPVRVQLAGKRTSAVKQCKMTALITVKCADANDYGSTAALGRFTRGQTIRT